MTRFEGKVALVTGAAGGIGAAIVRKLRAEGAKVAVADRDVSKIEADAHFPGNLLEAAYADGLPQATVSKLGRIDIICNNAGVITRGDASVSFRFCIDLRCTRNPPLFKSHNLSNET
jgi:2-keto-3-deoxy-L-fuconate dehydrogenase